MPANKKPIGKIGNRNFEGTIYESNDRPNDSHYVTQLVSFGPLVGDLMLFGSTISNLIFAVWSKFSAAIMGVDGRSFAKDFRRFMQVWDRGTVDISEELNRDFKELKMYANEDEMDAAMDAVVEAKARRDEGSAGEAAGLGRA